MRRRPRAESPPAVCIVRHNYYPDSHVRRDAEALAQAGYAITVIALRRSGQLPHETVNGVTVRRLPVQHRRGSVLRYLWEYLAFATLAFFTVTWMHLRRRFRVVEVDNMPDILVFSALVPKLTGTPVILYIFDNMPELLAYLWNTGRRHPLVRLLALLERISAAFADHVIVTQELPRRLAIGRGVPAEKLTVVLNCADETVFCPEAASGSAGSHGTFEIVTHGAILERYGIQVLIDALPRVISAVPNTSVQIFGEGEYRRELERQVEQLGLEQYVHFRGFAPLDELLETLANADVGYVGMLNDLVLPNKLMEYVALGVPVVLSRWPTFEHYFPEDSAAYFRAGDADDLATTLIGLYRDRSGARQRAARATMHYQHYRWPVQKEVYLRLYAELVQADRMQHADARQPSKSSS